jgi:HAD superfamily hydrolase (TIGR01490 family)
MTKGRPFAVFDIDGTLIRWQLYHAVADALIKLGFVESGAYEDIRAARMSWKTRQPGKSFRTYEHELIRVYESMLANLTTDQLDKAVQAVFDEYKDQVYTYTRQLIKQLKAENYCLLAISGSQAEIVRLVAKYYGFDDYLATVYERSGQRFSGHKTVPSLDKAKALGELIQNHQLVIEGSLAIGDSLSDAAMLEMVERPVAFNPDKDLYAVASRNRWKIVIERKNMIYELEKHGGKYQLAAPNRG